MNSMQNARRSLAKKRLAVVLLGGVGGVAIGLAGVYGIGHIARNVGLEPVCLPAVETARRLTPLIHGEIAALSPAAAPKRLPERAFPDAAGQSKKLADWRGRTVLLNLWATWCVPCRKEMPALDALQDKLGGPGFEVVAVNIDTRD